MTGARAAVEIVTSAYDPDTRAWDTIDRVPITFDVERDLSSVRLVADDFGGTVGDTYRVALVDKDGNVLDETEVVAK